MRNSLAPILMIMLLSGANGVTANFPYKGSYLGLDSRLAESYSQYDGKLTLIEAFATWCTPCKTEQFELSLVNEVFNSEQENLTIFTLSVSPGTDNLVDIQDFKDSAEEELDFVATWEFGLDIRQGDNPNFAEYFGISIIPTTLLINPEGEVVKMWEGVVVAETIINYIDSNITFIPPDQSKIFLGQVFNNFLFQVFLVSLILLVIYRVLIPKPQT